MLACVSPLDHSESNAKLFFSAHSSAGLQEDQSVKVHSVLTLAKLVIAIIGNEVLVDGDDQTPFSDGLIDYSGIFFALNPEVGRNIDVRLPSEA